MVIIAHTTVCGLNAVSSRSQWWLAVCGRVLVGRNLQSCINCMRAYFVGWVWVCVCASVRLCVNVCVCFYFAAGPLCYCVRFLFCGCETRNTEQKQSTEGNKNNNYDGNCTHIVFPERARGAMEKIVFFCTEWCSKWNVLRALAEEKNDDGHDGSSLVTGSDNCSKCKRNWWPNRWCADWFVGLQAAVMTISWWDSNLISQQLVSAGLNIKVPFL